MAGCGLLLCQTPNPTKKPLHARLQNNRTIASKFQSRLLGIYNADMEIHIVFCKIGIFTGMQLLALQRA